MPPTIFKGSGTAGPLPLPWSAAVLVSLPLGPATVFTREVPTSTAAACEHVSKRGAECIHVLLLMYGGSAA